MDVTSLTSTIASAIIADALFTADGVVYEDYGTIKTQKEQALDVDATPPAPGYNISVWPPSRGSNHDNVQSTAISMEVGVVVRFEINPKGLPSDPPAAKVWITTRLKAIMQDVIGLPMDNSGNRFQLAADPFELVNFDEGLIAYHIRFVRFATFGQ